MTYEEAANRIRIRMVEGMEAQRPDVPVVLPNTGDAVRHEPWVALFVQPATGRQVEVGGRDRYTGTIIVQVFVPQGDGDGEAWAIADAVKEALGRGTHDGVLYRSGYVDNVGGDGRGWHQLNVNVPFQFEHP